MYITRPSGPAWPSAHISLFIRKGGHWPPSAFLETNHDRTAK